jgi:hypothetical protein
MKELVAVIRQFPMQELAIRRLYASDPEFRDICEDYVTANCALERWQADMVKAAEFREMSEEIEREILKYIEKRQYQSNNGE